MSTFHRSRYAILLLTIVGMQFSLASGTHFSGDVRFRYEIDQSTSKDNPRDRQRVRLRFAMTHEAGLIRVGGRLSTASNSVQSPHHTLGTADASDNANFGLDQAYIELEPFPGSRIVLGKAGANWWQQNEVMIDDDLSPEGIAGSYDAGGFRLNAAYYVVTEEGWNGVAGDDNMIWLQILHATTFSSSSAIIAIGRAVITDAGYAGGMFPNRTVNAGSLQFQSHRFTLGFDYMLSDAIQENQGIVAMVKGTAKGHNIGLWYYDVGSQSTLNGGFSQDNFPNSVGFSGYRFQIGAKFFQQVGTDLRYYYQKMDESGAVVSRFQINLNVKF